MRVQLGAIDGEPSLELSGEKGKSRAVFAASKDMTLGLYDEKGEIRAGLGLNKDGPSLDLFDENSMTRAVLGVQETKQPDGTETKHPESSLWLFGPNGKRLWSAP
jgi:hypothetical protein